MLKEFDVSTLKDAPICKHCHINLFKNDEENKRPSSPDYAIDINSIENLIKKTCLDKEDENTTYPSSYLYSNHTIFKNNKNPNLISHHGLLKRDDILLNWVCYNCTKCQKPIASYFYFYSLINENEHAKYLHFSHSMENIEEEYRNIWLVACQMLEYFKQKGYATHVIVPSKNTTSLLYLMNASESIGQNEMIIDP
eukprot:jgi/Orpsp1_1/1174389/evm.model.c7180000049910.1